jgi:hypothetical protein
MLAPRPHDVETAGGNVVDVHEDAAAVDPQDDGDEGDDEDEDSRGEGKDDDEMRGEPGLGGGDVGSAAGAARGFGPWRRRRDVGELDAAALAPQ